MTTTSKNLLASLRWMSASYTLTGWRAGASDAAQVTALRCAVQCDGLRRRQITFAHTASLGATRSEMLYRSRVAAADEADANYELWATAGCKRNIGGRRRDLAAMHVRKDSRAFAHAAAHLVLANSFCWNDARACRNGAGAVDSCECISYAR